MMDYELPPYCGGELLCVCVVVFVTVLFIFEKNRRLFFLARFSSIDQQRKQLGKMGKTNSGVKLPVVCALTHRPLFEPSSGFGSTFQSMFTYLTVSLSRSKQKGTLGFSLVSS